MAVYRDQPRIYNADLTAIVPRARLNFYSPSTTTLKDSYAEMKIIAPFDGGASTTIFATPHPNPLQADEAARIPAVYLNGETRILIEDEDGNEIVDLDPVPISDGVAIIPGPATISPLSDDGEALPFATLTLYRSKTTMLETLSEENPITADSLGVFADISIDTDIAYRALLHDGDGRLVYDVDPYFAGSMAMGVDSMPKIAAARVLAAGTLNAALHVTSVDINGIGDYTVNFENGFFTQLPICSLTIENFGFSGGSVPHIIWIVIDSSNASSVRVNTKNITMDSASDMGFTLIATEAPTL